jgi:hypothetical protein
MDITPILIRKQNQNQNQKKKKTESESEIETNGMSLHKKILGFARWKSFLLMNI